MDIWVEGISYKNEKSLINLRQITEIVIGRYDNESEDICRVLVRYDTGAKAITLYTGTQVECFRVYDKLCDKLGSIKLEPWD